VQVRRALASDWQASRDIRLRALADVPDAFSSTLERELAFGDEVWIGRIESAHTLMAWQQGRPIATITGIVDRREPGSREIVALWVEPAHRRTGVARTLVLALVDWARDDAADAIALWVTDANSAARLLYERCGFVATGQRDTVRPGLEEARMRRPLSVG
jgi:GNAT superfamily N-acetyltransferase